jgi:hypothetical protein
VKRRPGEAGAVVLVTDGEPQGPAPLCAGVNPEDPAVIANYAATVLSGSPSVRTFVVGLPGVNVAVANQIAAAGGTGAAILATDPSRVEDGFRDALAVVRGKAVPCDLALPPQVLSGEISHLFVNVLYSKGGVPPERTLFQDPTCASGEGWRYDDPSMPTKIFLCPNTCAEVQSDPQAKVEILLGCQTVVK